MIISNVVKKEKLREIQIKTLKELRENLECSFGPMGSNTCIKRDNAFTQYSKDGHTILSMISYNGPIEQAVKEDIESITRYITTTVGDGTTSAVILSEILFNKLNNYLKKNEDSLTPSQLITEFKNIVDSVKDVIKKNAHETTPDNIYNIAMISTNGNETIAENLKNIYTEFGNNVFIDVAISNSVDSMLKMYDGLTLSTGYADSIFVNNKSDNSCVIRNPRIYAFEDPIDTVEMISFFDRIVGMNIIKPISNNEQVIPTVIMTPKLSKDMSSIMDGLTNFLTQMNINQRPPICVITNIHQQDEYMDIAKLCGATCIKKYIDPKIQEQDIEKGLAPTPETIDTFSGACEEIVVDAGMSKFINPEKMFDENHEKSELYKSMVDYLETAIKLGKESGEDNHYIGSLKRRLNAINANMVEYLVGGITMADRDSIRDLVEDAVLNCRSAAKNGTGYAANFEGLRASKYLLDTNNGSSLTPIIKIIHDAYLELSEILYSHTFVEVAPDYVQESLVKNMPINLRTKEFDNKVLSSIESDIIILDTIAKIVSLMFTCNQFIVPTPVHNVYVEI